MTDTKKLDRVEPSFFEGDDEGYWQATDEAGEDGFAKGISFTMYVTYPWAQTGPTGDAGKVHFTEKEKNKFVEWVQEEYDPADKRGDKNALGWGFTSDDIFEVEFFGEYLPGESTGELALRVCNSDSRYLRLHNEGTIFYHLRDKFAEHCGIDIARFYGG